MVLAYLDRTDRIREVAEQSILPKMGTQIADDGSLPQELKRTLSLHYSTFALEALMEANQITSQVGINLWSTPAPNGKSGFTGSGLSISLLSESRKLEIQTN